MNVVGCYYRLQFPMRPNLKLGGKLWKQLVKLEVKHVIVGNIVVGENVIAHLNETSSN